jgi:pseudaminic acid synthase
MIKLNNKINISYKEEPKIIAEISGNHGGSKKKFLKLIKSACLNGADLIKIQTYEPKDITLNYNYGKFVIKEGVWKNQNLWNLYKKACTPFSWHKEAFELAKKYKKIIFSSPFSIRAVNLLENLGCKIYKIASFEITDVKLIDYIASKKKPIIISTGMANLKEIKRAINIIEKYHSKITILHCVSSYPTKLENINLQRIEILKKKFPKYLIGLSDHTDDIYSSIVATQLGVAVIEKHFKINNFDKTADSSFSLTPEKLRALKDITFKISKSKKKINKNVENISFNLRRSIFAKDSVKKNQKITKDNIESLRPLIGICASKYFNIIGKKTRKNIKKGDPIFSKDLI